MVHETLTEGGSGRLAVNHVQYALICCLIVNLLFGPGLIVQLVSSLALFPGPSSVVKASLFVVTFVVTADQILNRRLTYPVMPSTPQLL